MSEPLSNVLTAEIVEQARERILENYTLLSENRSQLAQRIGFQAPYFDEAANIPPISLDELSKQAVAAAPHPVESLDDRTIAHFHKLGYTHLSAEMIKDINYLEQLASTTGTNIEDWKPIELLTPIERGNKRAINKLFFTKVEDRKQVIGELDKETFERIQRSLFESSEARKQRSVSAAKGNYDNAMYNVRERTTRLNELIKQASIYYDEFRRLEGITPDSTMAEFQKLLQNKFYKFERFAINKAYFTTASDVIIRYRNISRGEDWVMDFGKLRIMLDLHNVKMTATKFERNVNVGGGYYHPFISTSGEICFGTMANTAKSKLTQHMYSDVFDILAALLTTYDGGSNPYMSLGEFIQKEKEGKAQREGSVNMCGTCHLAEDNCECHYCECCQENTAHRTEDCDDYCHDCGSFNNQECGCHSDSGDTF